MGERETGRMEGGGERERHRQTHRVRERKFNAPCVPRL